ncbi:MAG: SDR family oxidoreductase [Clostridiales bacterium]|nr:SDR family oxidoreductase [Clostridiales bacterium]
MKLPLNVDFTGRVAVVTGAGGVLCSCMSKALAAAGAKVALLDINQEAVQAVVEEILADGGDAIAVKCDILNEEEIQKAHETVLEKYGRTNILINGAGGNNPRCTTTSEVFEKSQLGNEKTFFDLDQDGFRFVFDINFTGEFMVTKEFAKDMLDGGNNSILNIASVNTYLPLTKIPAYAAAKEAVGNFTKWLAMYFSKSGIRVNAIAPGFLSTHQTKALFYEADGVTPTPRLGKIIEGTPMKRLGKPEELLGAVLFLLDEEASGFITGAILPVDGGYTAYSGV